ncbi:hypothetical protein V8E55_002759 [Tylopilus felleus]
MLASAPNPGESSNAEPDKEHSGTLATPPTIDWKDTLLKLQKLTSNCQVKPVEVLPATPEGASQRYKPRTVNLFNPDQFDIPAGQQTLLSSRPSLSDGSKWKRHVHPEGGVLFYHQEFHLFTEHDISDPIKEENLFACVAQLVEKAIKADDVTLDEHTHIVLNVDNDGDWHYYFVDHTNHLLFWVDKVSARDLGIELRGISGYNHIIHGRVVLLVCIFRESFQSHCEYYPHNRALPKKAFEDLRGMLNYAKIDMITTDSSSSPFGQDELVAMLGLVDSLKDVNEISDPYSIWAIARLMAYFTENQFLNFCGQACARLNADTPLFGKQDWDCHILFKVVNLFLLGSPNEHALRLQRVWVDDIINQPRWKDFVTRLTTELARYTIFSTVMLAVNFSLLSVPGVVNVNAPAGPIQIIVYCSVVSTIASIVFSFGLLNVYSSPRLLIARNVLEAMWKLSRTKTGMACLSITHSLPIASLIWSIALFSVALAVQIFGPKQHATVSTLSVECLIIAIFMVIGVRVMRHFSKNDDGDEVLDISVEKHSSPTGSPRDIEQGQGN